jgi:hypothetical protein
MPLKGKAEGASVYQRPDETEFARALALLTDPDPGSAFELRAVGLTGGASSKVFTPAALEDTVRWAVGQHEDGTVYLCLNPIKPDTPIGKGRAVRDDDVTRRRWLLLDIDPARAEGFLKDSATDQEKEAAVSLAGQVKAHLTGLGWPLPVEADSGNGHYLLYRIDEPNDETAKELLRKALLVLSAQFNQGGSIDTSVYNASRIAKLPGGWARKGPGTADRPHRMSRLVSVPDSVLVVTRAQLEALAATPIPEQNEPVKENGQAQAARSSLQGTATSGVPTAEQRAIGYLKWQAQNKPAVQGQSGSTPTIGIARKVVYGFGMGVERGIELLREYYNPFCVPPWSEKELRHKCEDADKEPFELPRCWLLTEGPRAAGWEEPLPFTEPCTPPFPTDALPGWLGRYVDALAVATQTPPDLAAVLALAVAGAAMARKYRVLIRPGWSQPLNLYTVVALPPANRKSAVFREVTEPAATYEREEAERLQSTVAERAADRRMLEGRLKSTESRAAKAKDNQERERLRQEAKALVQELGEFREVTSPQIIADDITPEAVGKRLAQQGGRLLVASAEGTVFEIACGRYSEGHDHLDNFLKAHEGDRIRVDRVGRESDYVDDPALSMALAVQPVIIKGQAAHATSRGKGFMARWLYAVPKSPIGTRLVAAPPVPEEVAAAFRGHMLALWRAPGGVDANGNKAVGWFRFGPEADAVLRNFEAWLEPHLAEDGDLGWVADWAGKLAGAAARVAAILHACAGIASGTSMPAVIPAATAEAAVRLAKDYLIPHACAAFDLMRSDDRTRDCRRAVDWLRRTFVNCVNGIRVVSRRDLHANLFGSRYSPEEVDGVINLLVRRGYLRKAEEDAAQKQGRPSSPRFEVHPSLFASGDPGNGSHNSQNSGEGGGLL